MAATMVIATGNVGKLREFQALLDDLPLRVISARDAGMTEFPPEVGTTFAENARAKASFVAQATGLPALADDSGLVIDALDGAPGVLSARFGGPDATDTDRWQRVLHLLDGVPPERRTARFVAAIAFVRPDGTMTDAEGIVEGTITDQARGDGGFGYDPIFLVAETDRTLAEMTDDEKNAISHRARALQAIRPALRAFVAESENLQ